MSIFGGNSGVSTPFGQPNNSKNNFFDFTKNTNGGNGKNGPTNNSKNGPTNNNLRPNQKNGYADPRRNVSTRKKKPFIHNDKNNNSEGGKNPTKKFEKNNNGEGGKNITKKFDKNNQKPFKNNQDGPKKNNQFDVKLSSPAEDPIRVIPRQSQDKFLQVDDNENTVLGSLFPDPEGLGFQRNRSSNPRPISRYLLSQPRQLITPEFQQNAWDKQNQDKMLQMEAANNGKDFQGLYEEFQKMREVERLKMESLGLVDAENISKDLNDAISFQGSCLDMCPIFERVRRALENNVKALEKDPATNKISRSRAVKAFSRPAAGQPPPLPSEVRPPHILKQTLDYLVDNIVPQLPEAHSFIWDRTRSIRQDFTYQNFFGSEAIDCNERIVRIHLVSLHIMAGSDVEYSQQQEIEQFNKALQTLVEIYQDIRNHGGRAPNEAEFRAYHLLSHIRDPELEREIQQLPNDIFESESVQLALKFRAIVSQNNIIERGYNNTVGALNLYLEFFKLVYSDKTPFLVACLLETHFNEIRFYALKSMSRCFHTRGRAISAESLKTILGFDSIEKLVKFVKYYEVDIDRDETGELLVDLFNKEKLESKYKLSSVHDKPKLSQPYSKQIDIKSYGRDLSSFINSGHPTVNLNLKSADDRSIVMATKINKSVFAKTLAMEKQKPASVGGQSKNLSDFLNSSSLASGGFGAPQASTKPPVAFGELPAAFGKPSSTVAPLESKAVPSQLSVGSHMSSSPALSFGAKPSTTPQQFGSKPVLPPSDSKSALAQLSFGPNSSTTAPQFGLDSKPASSTATIDFKKPISQLPKIQALKTESGSLFQAPALKHQGLTTVAKTPDIPQETFSVTKVPTTLPKAAAAPPPPVVKKLVDSPSFGPALNQVYHEILQAVIGQELRYFLPKLIKQEHRKQERISVLNSLSNELYQAFLSEIIYKKSLEIQADNFYNQSLKKATIKRLILKGIQLNAKHELRKKKLNELNSISFRIPSLKRKLSNSSFSSVSSVGRESKKRHNFSEHKVDNVSERQNEVKKLWEPLNLQEFLHECSKNIKVNIESDNVELKFLLVVENWLFPYSKWLNTKLSLVTNKEKLIYEKTVKDDKLSIHFQSLPSSNYLSLEFFKDTSFLLFESGFLTDEQSHQYNGSLKNKLQRDEGILNKIIQLLSRFSYYKVQIVILFWDTQNHHPISQEEVFQLLNIENHRKNPVIEEIILSDMTNKDSNINDTLTLAVKQLSRQFQGQLTERGTKQKEKIKKKLKLQELKLQEESNKRKSAEKEKELMKSKEQNLLKRAKLNRQYGYLTNHLAQPQSSPKGSANNSFDATSLYLSAINRTRGNISNNSTYLNLNNSIGGNTTILSNNDVLILPGFGLGVGEALEESTPAASPNGKFTRPAVPKNVQQLRDLTASIKSKYKR